MCLCCLFGQNEADVLWIERGLSYNAHAHAKYINAQTAGSASTIRSRSCSTFMHRHRKETAEPCMQYHQGPRESKTCLRVKRAKWVCVCSSHQTFSYDAREKLVLSKTSYSRNRGALSLDLDLALEPTICHSMQYPDLVSFLHAH